MIEENKTFEEAYERLKKASSDETLMAMYRNREKAIRDWCSFGIIISGMQLFCTKLAGIIQGALLHVVFRLIRRFPLLQKLYS